MQEAIVKRAVSLLANYFGESTASMYEKFYAQKDPQIVLNSLNELLGEYLGKEKAKGILTEFASEFNLKL